MEKSKTHKRNGSLLRVRQHKTRDGKWVTATRGFHEARSFVHDKSLWQQIPKETKQIIFVLGNTRSEMQNSRRCGVILPRRELKAACKEHEILLRQKKIQADELSASVPVICRKFRGDRRKGLETVILLVLVLVPVPVPVLHIFLVLFLFLFSFSLSLFVFSFIFVFSFSFRFLFLFSFSLSPFFFSFSFRFLFRFRFPFFRLFSLFFAFFRLFPSFFALFPPFFALFPPFFALFRLFRFFRVLS